MELIFKDFIQQRVLAEPAPVYDWLGMLSNVGEMLPQECRAPDVWDMQEDVFRASWSRKDKAVATLIVGQEMIFVSTSEGYDFVKTPQDLQLVLERLALAVEINNEWDCLFQDVDLNEDDIERYEG